MAGYELEAQEADPGLEWIDCAHDPALEADVGYGAPERPAIDCELLDRAVSALISAPEPEPEAGRKLEIG